MAQSFCKNCNQSFAYEKESGLNVKYFECEFDRHSFRAGGDFPVCPKCLAQCYLQPKEGYESAQVKVVRYAIPMEIDFAEAEIVESFERKLLEGK